MSLVAEGDVFAFWGSRDLRLVFVVVELGEHTEEYAITKVLLLDAPYSREEHGEFRADPGQITDWHFNTHDPEWRRLVRLS